MLSRGPGFPWRLNQISDQRLECPLRFTFIARLGTKRECHIRVTKSFYGEEQHSHVYKRVIRILFLHSKAEKYAKDISFVASG